MNRISLRYSLLAAALATLAPSAAHGEVLNLQKLGFNARPVTLKLALSFNYESNGKTHTCLIRVKNKSLTGSAMVAETPIWTSDDEGQVKRDDKAECSYDTRKREAKSKSAFLVIKFPGAEE